jgi:hypothetical protein
MQTPKIEMKLWMSDENINQKQLEEEVPQAGPMARYNLKLI